MARRSRPLLASVPSGRQVSTKGADADDDVDDDDTENGRDVRLRGSRPRAATVRCGPSRTGFPTTRGSGGAGRTRRPAWRRPAPRRAGRRSPTGTPRPLGGTRPRRGAASSSGRGARAPPRPL